MSWHSPPDTGSETWALAVSGRERYLSVTKAPQNIESLRAGKKHFVSLKLKFKVRTRDLLLPKQAALTTAPGPPTFNIYVYESISQRALDPRFSADIDHHVKNMLYNNSCIYIYMYFN